MVESLHPAASHELPSFITAPGETDVLMVIMGLVLLFSVLGFGVFFFRLHTLPERMAHKTHKLQFELVAVLGLIALFTHMHIFWVAGLLLALVDLPDFGTPLNRIATSAEQIAGRQPDDGTVEMPPASVPSIGHAEPTAKAPPKIKSSIRQGDGAAYRPQDEHSSEASPRI